MTRGRCCRAGSRPASPRRGEAGSGAERAAAVDKGAKGSSPRHSVPGTAHVPDGRADQDAGTHMKPRSVKLANAGLSLNLRKMLTASLPPDKPEGSWTYRHLELP